MQVGATTGTAAVQPDFCVEGGAARGAPDDLAKPRHVDIARPVLRNPARAGRRAGFLGRARGLRLGLTAPVVILVAAQAVFAVAHGYLVARRGSRVTPRPNKVTRSAPERHRRFYATAGAGQTLQIRQSDDPKSGRYGLVVMNLVRLGGVMTVLIMAWLILIMRRRESRPPAPSRA